MSESGRRSSRREASLGGEGGANKPSATAATAAGEEKTNAKSSKNNATAATGASEKAAGASTAGGDGVADESTSAAAPASAPAAAGSKRGKQSIRASDLKRKKLVPRCTSPSHFLLEESSGLPASSVSVSTPLPSALSADPSAPSGAKLADANARIDHHLHSIASMYYRNQTSLAKDASGPAEVWISSDYDKLEYPTLDLLISPLRKPNVLDNWCPREIALFEAGICAVGKDFHAIANLISTKSCKECVDFYYVWKKSSHYAMWKNFGKPNKKPHANKEEQWKAIREQMRQGSNATAPTAVKKEA